MGQKVNPNFTRINLDKNYLSKWYSKKKDYSLILHEDNVIRFLISKIFHKTLSLSNIIIKRITNTTKDIGNFCYVSIHAKFPSLLKSAKYINILSYNEYQINNVFKKETKKFFIQKLFILIIKKYSRIIAQILSIKYNKIYIFSFYFIKNKFLDPNLIANSIIKEVKKRKNIIFVLKNTINRLKRLKVKGAYIQVSGRLNGAERAKIKWFRFGSVPAQTFSKNVISSKKRIKTNSGVLGIKIMLHLANNEITT